MIKGNIGKREIVISKVTKFIGCIGLCKKSKSNMY
jgi:hypothetical protein